MELEQHYREKKDYSVREMRIRHEGKEKSLNEMSNEIVLRVNSVIEKIRRSIEERWVSFKNTSLEPTYVKHF